MNELFEPNSNTKVEYDCEISQSYYLEQIQKIASITDLSKDQVCYVFGMGSQPRSTYDQLSLENGFEVKWYESILKGAIRFFSFIVASYAGLIKVNDMKRLPYLVNKMGGQSMIGIYIFNKSIEKQFIRNVVNNDRPKKLDFGVKSDASYFIYIVDSDNYESESGIYEVVSYGTRAHNYEILNAK